MSIKKIDFSQEEELVVGEQPQDTLMLSKAGLTAKVDGLVGDDGMLPLKILVSDNIIRVPGDIKLYSWSKEKATDYLQLVEKKLITIEGDEMKKDQVEEPQVEATEVETPDVVEEVTETSVEEVQEEVVGEKTLEEPQEETPDDEDTQQEEVVEAAVEVITEAKESKPKKKAPKEAVISRASVIDAALASTKDPDFDVIVDEVITKCGIQRDDDVAKKIKFQIKARAKWYSSGTKVNPFAKA